MSSSEHERDGKRKKTQKKSERILPDFWGVNGVTSTFSRLALRLTDGRTQFVQRFADERWFVGRRS